MQKKLMDKQLNKGEMARVRGGEGVNPGPAQGAGVDGFFELYAFNHTVSLPTDVRD